MTSVFVRLHAVPRTYWSNLRSEARRRRNRVSNGLRFGKLGILGQRYRETPLGDRIRVFHARDSGNQVGDPRAVLGDRFEYFAGFLECLTFACRVLLSLF